MDSSLAEALKVKRLTSKDEAEVLDLIAHHYVRDYYFEKYGLHGKEIGKYCEIRARFLLKQNLSVGVFEKATGKLVAITLCTVDEKLIQPSKEDLAKEKFELTPELKVLYQIYASLRVGHVEDLKTDKIFYTAMGTVHKHYRKHKVNALQIAELIKVAEEQGCLYASHSVTSDFMIKAALRNNWRIHKEFYYPDYVDPMTGEKPFANMKPQFQRILWVSYPLPRKTNAKL